MRNDLGIGKVTEHKQYQTIKAIGNRVGINSKPGKPGQWKLLKLAGEYIRPSESKQ